MNEKFPTLHIVNHPLVQHKLTVMRDKNTSVKDFRELVSRDRHADDAMRPPVTCRPPEDLSRRRCGTLRSATLLAGKKLAIVPILRAGLGMVDGMLNLIPSARVAHIGLYRDAETLEPVNYYSKMPAGHRRARRADRGSHAGHRRQPPPRPSTNMKELRLQAHQADDAGGRARGRAVHL